MHYYQRHIFICTNQKKAPKKCCAMGGGDPMGDHLKDLLKSKDLWGPGKIRVTKTGCLGRCKAGPCLVIYPEGVWYTYRSEADIQRIVALHCQKGEKVTDLLLPDLNFSL